MLSQVTTYDQTKSWLRRRYSDGFGCESRSPSAPLPFAATLSPAHVHVLIRRLHVVVSLITGVVATTAKPQPILNPTPTPRDLLKSYKPILNPTPTPRSPRRSTCSRAVSWPLPTPPTASPPSCCGCCGRRGVAPAAAPSRPISADLGATSAQEGPLALFNGWLPTYFRRAHETRTLAFRAASPHSHCAVRPPPLPCLVSHGGAP